MQVGQALLVCFASCCAQCLVTAGGNVACQGNGTCRIFLGCCNCIICMIALFFMFK